MRASTFVGLKTSVGIQRSPPRVQLDVVSSSHGKAGAVHHAPDAAVHPHKVEPALARLKLVIARIRWDSGVREDAMRAHVRL